MVAQQVIDDLLALRADIDRARGAGGAEPSDYGRWLLVLGFVLARLVGRPCPECGEQMQWNATLDAHACSHNDTTEVTR